jgi:hypothetical protein
VAHPPAGDSGRRAGEKASLCRNQARSGRSDFRWDM